MKYSKQPIKHQPLEIHYHYRELTEACAEGSISQTENIDVEFVHIKMKMSLFCVTVSAELVGKGNESCFSDWLSPITLFFQPPTILSFFVFNKC